MGVDQHQVAAVLLLAVELDELLGVHLAAHGLALLLLLAILDLGHLALGVHGLQNLPQGLVRLGRGLVLLGQPLAGLLVADALQVLGGVDLDQRLDAAVHGVLAQIADIPQIGQSRLPQLHLVEDGIQLLQLDALAAQGHVLGLPDIADHAVFALLTLLEELLGHAALGHDRQAELSKQLRQILPHDLVAGGILVVIDEHQDGGPTLVLAIARDDVDQLGHAQADGGVVHAGAVQRLDSLQDDLLQLDIAGLEAVDSVLIRQEVELLVGDLDALLGQPLQPLAEAERGHIPVAFEDTLRVLFVHDEYH